MGSSMLLRGPLARVRRRALHTTRMAPASLMERLFGTGEVFKHSLVSPAPYAPPPNFVPSREPGSVNVTKLKNGVRVASQDFGSNVSAVALLFDAGSRYEDAHTAGASLVLERTAFKGSLKRSRAQMVRETERLGATFTCAATRETMGYCAEGLRAQVPEMFTELSESAITPRVILARENDVVANFETTELQRQIDLMKADVSEINKDPNNRVIEALHGVAYSGNTLGLPLTVPVEQLEKVTVDALSDYVNGLYSGRNLVVSACNVDHEELVKLAEDHLGHLDAGQRNLPRLHSKYSGGEYRAGLEGATHFALGFEGHGWLDDDFVAQCVLHTLMGGGGSFSSGGPGKGLYTRLFSTVLHRHHWVHSAVALNNVYSDTSLFGVQASADPDHARDLVEVITTAAENMRKEPSASEVNRAKNQTKATMLLNLESRIVVCEDIGRQLLNAEKYISPAEFSDRIDKVTPKQLQKVADALLSSRPSYVLLGEQQNAPTYISTMELLHSPTSKKISK